MFPLTILFALFMNTAQPASPAPVTEGPTFYDFTLKTIDGQLRQMSAYKGKVVMVVNVASKCGYTPQYEGLEELYKRYSDKGFMIIGIPANNFLQQEPGTDAQIKQFCSTTYGVTFDMYSKVSVKGDDQHPLYKFLTAQPGVSGSVKWNFQKYLVNRRGAVVARFSPGTEPLEKEVIAKVEALLNEPA